VESGRLRPPAPVLGANLSLPTATLPPPVVFITASGSQASDGSV
jgi:hypothetical protein